MDEVEVGSKVELADAEVTEDESEELAGVEEAAEVEVLDEVDDEASDFVLDALDELLEDWSPLHRPNGDWQPLPQYAFVEPQ